VLPSLLAIWTRFVGPADVDRDVDDAVATGERVATRDIERTVAAPGDSVVVTVSVAGLNGRSVVHETSDAPVSFRDAAPVPVDTATADGSLYAAFETDAATVEYTVDIPADATDGASFDIEGDVLAGDEATKIEGEATIQVIPDLFERITVAGEVSDADLRLATDQYETGELSETQMDRIHRAWVRGELAEEQ
jgi:hypothetical protein